MDGNIVIAIIGGLASITASIITVISVIVTSNKNNAAVDAKLDKQQAVIETKLNNLTEEVSKHNSFASRIPVIEVQVTNLTQRIDKLEREVGT